MTTADVYRYIDAPPSDGADAPTFVDHARDWAVRVVVIQHYETYPDQSLPEHVRDDIVCRGQVELEPDAETFAGRAFGVKLSGALAVAKSLLADHTTINPDALDRGGVALFSDGVLDRVDVETDITYRDGVEYVHHGNDADPEGDPPVIYGGTVAIAELTPLQPRPVVVAAMIDPATGELGAVTSGGRPIANSERGR